MVRIGFVKVTRDHPGGEEVLAYVGPGGYFGEIGLMADDPEVSELAPAGLRTATCKALDHVDIVRMKAADFKQILIDFPTVADKIRARAIDILQKKLIAYWAMRYGADMKTPSASIQGPKVMITDETAGSGGDLLPWMFRRFQLGTIVGGRTWGGLVGILGFPALMDGGGITAPNLAIWDPEKGWVVENVGVPPDIEVEQDPAAVASGKDPQLDRAIAVILAELAQSQPPKAPVRPPFPVRVRPRDHARAAGLKSSGAVGSQ